MVDREEFQRNFPVPFGVKWSEKRNDYTCESIQDIKPAVDYSGQWQAWKAASAQSGQCDEWIKCSERLPTEADGYVWIYFGSQRRVSDQVWSWDDLQVNQGETHWKPTGLKRPKPPKESEAMSDIIERLQECADHFPVIEDNPYSVFVDARDEIITLRQQLEQAQAMVAELEGTGSTSTACPFCFDQMRNSYILHKQAEAVELVAEKLTDSRYQSQARKHAQNLRKQADELDELGDKNV